MGRAHKSQGTNKQPCVTGAGATRAKSTGAAGNHRRANALPVSGVLQAKLTIGKANDPFEQEADRVAGEVMRTSADTAISNLAPSDGKVVQRKCSCGGGTGGCDKCKKKQLSLKRRDGVGSSGQLAEIPSSIHEVLSGGGQPLDNASRAFMEPRFGYDFSPVRVHTNSAAARAARDVSALAFTVGNHIAFAAGQYRPGSEKTNRLLAHELAHVVQQGGAEPQGQQHDQSPTVSEQGQALHRKVSNVIQRAGDPLAIPPAFACPTDLVPGAPAGTDILFPTADATITPAHTALLTAFVAAWVASGGTDDILVHGYASTPGDQDMNWTLSCSRAQAVEAELIRLGVPAVNIDIVAHGESTDFGASAAANQHAVVSTSAAGIFSNPFIFTTFTPRDDFAGRSHSRVGVGEIVDLDFFSLPPRPAADFGGLTWVVAAGTGALSAVTNIGTATYTAPALADPAVRLELRVATGATAGARHGFTDDCGSGAQRRKDGANRCGCAFVFTGRSNTGRIMGCGFHRQCICRSSGCFIPGRRVRRGYGAQCDHRYLPRRICWTAWGQQLRPRSWRKRCHRNTPWATRRNLFRQSWTNNYSLRYSNLWCLGFSLGHTLGVSSSGRRSNPVPWRLHRQSPRNLQSWLSSKD